jgi:hypothetical protein
MKDLVPFVSEVMGFYLGLLLPMWIGLMLLLLHVCGLSVIAWLIDFVPGSNAFDDWAAWVDGLKGVHMLAVGLFFGAMGGVALSRQSRKL